MSIEVFFTAFYLQANHWINAFAGFVNGLPVSYSFGAGMLASVNPCGFIMLPAFAAFYFTSGGVAESPTRALRLWRALQMGILVTFAFVLTFGLAGVVISAGGYFIQQWIGWAGLAVGAALLVLGLFQLVSRRSLLSGATARIRVTRRATMTGVVIFGIAYAIASLGCTLPIFMTVAGSIFADDGSYLESMRRFVEYAVGMGLVLTVITLGIAVFREQTMRITRRMLPYVVSVGNVLLIFAGSYLIWYWSALGGVV